MRIGGNPAVKLRNFQLHPERAAKYYGRKVRIWSGEHRAYWRPGGAGYVTARAGAGVWDFREAWSLTDHCDPGKLIIFELVIEGDESGVTAKPLADWHEDEGPVVWWLFPVREAAWIGTPLDDTWPGYHTHWTPHPAIPMKPPRRRKPA